MFRNPNLRTYERKRPGIHSTTSVGNTIIREEVPPDKNIQSKELSNPEGEEDTTMDDPFDTTFDRLLKTVKLPPKPAYDVVESSYAGSSSDEERAKDDSPIPLPPMNEEPEVQKRRFFKGEKLDKKLLAVVTGGLKKAPSRASRPVKGRIVFDENTEPNVARSAVMDGTKRGKNRPPGAREGPAKRQRVGKMRTPIASYRGRKRKSLDDSTSLNDSTSLDDSTRLTKCSVDLTMLDLSDAPAPVENLPIDPSGNGKTDESENAATPGSGKMHENNEDRFATEEATSVEEFVKNPTTLVDATMTTEVAKPSGLLKNPTVCLTRLSVPQRFSVANKSWINSTPIDRRTVMQKTRLRLSPIDANGSMRIRHGADNSGQASLPPKSPVQEQVVVESAIPKSSQPPSEIDERSDKRPAFILSETPAPEPSCLLFDDSEEPEELSLTEASLADEEQSEKRQAIVLSESPAPEPSCLLFEDSETADEISQTDEKLQNVTEASTTTPLKGFSVESSDPESLQLRYEASNRTASSEAIAPFAEKAAAAEVSLVDEEIHGDTMETSATNEPRELTKDSSDGESLNFTLNDDDDEDEEDDEKSSKDLRLSIENADSVSQSAVPSEETADIADASTNEQLGGYAECSKNSTVESATNDSETFESDDWTTVTDSSYADADVSGDRNIFVKSRSERSEARRRVSIEQLSSDDDDSLSDDITELVNANDALSSHMEAATESSVDGNLEDGRNSMFEDINGNESKLQEMSVVEEAREKATRKDIHLNLRQPVVLLERLVLPVGKMRSTGSAKNIKLLNPSESIQSSKHSTLNSVNGSVSDIETPIPVKKSKRPLKKSKRPSKVGKTITTRFSENMESSQNSSLGSADGTVSDIEEPLPARKSRRLLKVDETKATSFSDTIVAGRNSTLSSADSSISDIETPIPAKKSKGSSKVEKIIATRFSENMNSSQNSSLGSADGTVSDIEEPLPARKSRGLTISQKAASKDSSDSIDSAQNSTLDSADETVSDIEEQLPTRKSRRLSNVSARKTKRLSKVETDIEKPLSTRKSRRLTLTKKARSKYPSDSLEVSGNPTPSEDSRNKSSLEGDEEPEIDGKTTKSSNRSMTDSRKRDAYEDTRLGSIKPVVLLTRLNDPVRVSLRKRQKYSNRNLQLSAIAENTGANAAPAIEEAHEENKISGSYRSTRNISPPSVKLSGEDINSQKTTASVDSSFSLNTINESSFDDRKDRPLFLKPGKLWARSLSILSNVHSQEDLESLAVGKGKKWRESAANILQMQQQGLLQSCVKKNEDDKESRSVYGVRNSAAAWSAESSQSNASRVFGATSPERFVRRVSIRVVPDCKILDRIEDSPFLEAYGISSSRNRQTISKRSTSLGPRKTLVYNVQDVRYDNISRGINSTTSRDVVLRQCGQETSLPFGECYPLSYLKHCRKIGEGVYGEVFLYEKGDEKNVIKIIPIEGEMNVNNERQKKFDEILSEIVIAKELHNLRFAESSSTSSFVEVKNIRCVAGKYPRKLIDLWKTYDDEKNSENDCPVMFDKNQLYIVLELGHGGQDLEAFVFQNASESHALFMQAALSLAVAEEKLDFEHRDLHWGNILISRTEDSHVEYKLRDKAIRLPSKGVKVSVIDFTLSRMSYQGCSIYNDLSMDEDLFSAQGEYQFDIYRLMRKKVENDWQRFEPFTNVLWLHYTLDKMITAARYRRKNSKIHNASIEKLQELKDTILDYKSAVDFVTNCDKATRLQRSRTSVTSVG